MGLLGSLAYGPKRVQKRLYISCLIISIKMCFSSFFRLTIQVSNHNLTSENIPFVKDNRHMLICVVTQKWHRRVRHLSSRSHLFVSHADMFIRRSGNQKSTN